MAWHDLSLESHARSTGTAMHGDCVTDTLSLCPAGILLHGNLLQPPRKPCCILAQDGTVGVPYLRLLRELLKQELRTLVKRPARVQLAHHLVDGSLSSHGEGVPIQQLLYAHRRSIAQYLLAPQLLSYPFGALKQSRKSGAKHVSMGVGLVDSAHHNDGVVLLVGLSELHGLLREIQRLHVEGQGLHHRKGLAVRRKPTFGALLRQFGNSEGPACEELLPMLLFFPKQVMLLHVMPRQWHAL
mmetsp:Transcript_25898/g.78745  ORF Transcript_25898/g.78745 Transcript_25898/m.78745 type:complete len:242 (+) Transcript_25898:140-865(+)